jgi:hypothetical protein
MVALVAHGAKQRIGQAKIVKGCQRILTFQKKTVHGIKSLTQRQSPRNGCTWLAQPLKRSAEPKGARKSVAVVSKRYQDQWPRWPLQSNLNEPGSAVAGAGLAPMLLGEA